MNNPLDLLALLIPYLKAYIRMETKPSTKGFAEFVLKQSQEEANGSKKSDRASAIALFEEREDHNSAIAFHLSRLNRYAKYYIKDALKDSALLNADDFGFLAAIIERDKISKSDLITFSVFEVPSGMEVIKRLVRNGLVSEQVSREDRRVKQLTATALGRTVFFEALHQMKKVGAIVSSKLNNEEKAHLVTMLKKLDHFHEHIYHEVPNYDLNTIVERFTDVEPGAHQAPEAG